MWQHPQQLELPHTDHQPQPPVDGRIQEANVVSLSMRTVEKK